MDNKKKFTELIKEHQKIIHKICNLYADTHDDRLDLKQEILYQLWKSFSSFNEQSKFSTWMYKVALNTAMVHVRKRKKYLSFIPFLKKHDYELNASSEYSEHKYDLMYSAISKLKKVDRSIVFLYLEKKTYKEIGEIIGVSEKNISVRLVRLKNKLRKIIEASISYDSF